MPKHVPRQARYDRGFTLFEVAISTVLVTFGVVSVLMLLPSGLKAQHHARMQIHASVMMQNLARSLVEPAQVNFNLQVETELPTNNQYLRRGLHDLEVIGEGTGLDLCQVPTVLAQRIDSDNDEINRIIAAGGRLYYSSPGGPPQSLVIGFIGAPQLNALPNHPSLAWPYWDNHPMAPAKWELESWRINSTVGNNPPERLWKNLSEFEALYTAFNTENNPKTDVEYTVWQTYIQRAKDLVLALAVPLETGNPLHPTDRGPIPRHPSPLPLSGGWGPMAYPQDDLDPRPDHLWAISHLAHAAGMATGALRNKPTGFPQEADRAYAKATYEACVAWVRRATTTNPYNWGVARHLSTMTAWDYPLLQHDVFPGGSFAEFLDSATGDRGYRIVSPVPVTHHGQARGVYGNYADRRLELIPANYDKIRNNWGNSDHFVLTRRFDPSERLRQVVFWSVDWQSYEDFESLPAPEHDASMCFRDSKGVHVSADWWGIRTPERGLYWDSAARTSRAGSTRNANGGNQSYDAWTDSVEYKAGYFMGIHGADRNGNKAFDRGPVPASVRLRATQIARFPIYDRILIGEGRH